MGIRSLRTSSISTGQKRSKFWDQSAVIYDGPFGAYEAIGSITLGTTSGTVTFSGIPQEYKHLQIRCVARTDRAVVLDSYYVYANSDSTSGGNYYAHGLYGTGASTAGAFTDAGNFMSIGVLAGTSVESNLYGSHIFDLLDYSNNNKYKTSRSIGGVDNNGSGQARLVSGLWKSTAPITSLTFTTNGGGSFIAGSKFSIYGVK